MNPALYRLVYLSRNDIEGGKTALEREIDAILDTARRHNAASGVTGALMFNAGCFAQVLEGSRDAIENTFERIQCDFRHRDVTLLAFAETDERRFANWSMAHVGGHSQASEQFGHIARESGFDLARLDGEQIFALLREHMTQA